MAEHNCTKEGILAKHEQAISDMETCKLPKMQENINSLFKYANDPETGSQHRLTKLEGEMKSAIQAPKTLMTILGLLMGLLLFISTASAYIAYKNSDRIQTYIMSHEVRQ